MKKLIASVLTPVAVATGLVLAPPANAAWTTIFPNYSDGNCPRGSVKQVKVAGFQGTTAISPFGQRWARLGVAKSGHIQLVAQLLCVNGKSSTWSSGIINYVDNPVPWKSYYF